MNETEQKTKIILVEDFKAIREFLKLFIERETAFKVVAEATTGAEAIEVINSIQADLIILDLNLPVKSGIQVLKEVRHTTAAKILAFTMRDNEAYIAEALDAGADGICLKDGGLETFRKAILQVSDSKQPFFFTSQ
jgi:DNA-binding NarL/FixJ family response regulator